MASYSEPYVSNGTGVFWDMDECKIPEGRTEADLVPFIREMLLGVGLRGPVWIRIYGDLTGLSSLGGSCEAESFSRRRET
ncbi:PREDICTED: uncharacterized protein LOC106310446 [Brassica oleracea var. oleracea]|uniref:uncharacterized protein LOC106310446 n=1 Tax=Brassica oleracea var. oleracea TaxID=109376 RepID=UPI0006A6D54A|nr:PREDICTED: uncharacterized protein LOC106310446 [Brassica oleracea var. oleracea]